MSTNSQVSIVEAQTQASNYLKAAWDMLPQLIMQRDLWALKGLTLIVGYETKTVMRLREEQLTLSCLDSLSPSELEAGALLGPARDSNTHGHISWLSPEALEGPHI